eukprot:CAMPEP_0203959156 /NCGR_PEP_ID=MMETSP0359-20131031/90321_1 /ASSEMBLY_ACC=CAM_ASM_000338 /TAXON_ID=268821 /ORGANISM="Scrippsiella Hangoei, Strain SHTV-5" /LENGTH=53 /DNA_ID=CAMNT_0050893197 /DNA_START=233 /DNA_END=394 /DNA_ORIENTATION=+
MTNSLMSPSISHSNHSSHRAEGMATSPRADKARRGLRSMSTRPHHSSLKVMSG